MELTPQTARTCHEEDRLMSADQRLADLGLTLPSAPKPIGNYVPFRLAGNLLPVRRRPAPRR